MAFGVFVTINGQTYMPFSHALKRCCESSAASWRQTLPAAKVTVSKADYAIQGRRQMVIHGVVEK